MSNRRSMLLVAARCALLAVVGIAYAVLTLSRIPETPPGDGFVAGLSAAFGLAMLSTSVLALFEAGLLALLTGLSDSASLPRKLLGMGAIAGGLAVLPTLSIELARTLEPGSPIASVFARLIAPFFGAWLLLAVLGLVSSGVGTLLHGTHLIRDRPGNR